MLKVMKIRSRCQITSTFVCDNTGICNLTLFRARSETSIQEESRFLIYCLLLIDRVSLPIPLKSLRFCVSGLCYKISSVIIADNNCPFILSFRYSYLHTNRTFIAILYTSLTIVLMPCYRNRRRNTSLQFSLHTVLLYQLLKHVHIIF